MILMSWADALNAFPVEQSPFFILTILLLSLGFPAVVKYTDNKNTDFEKRLDSKMAENSRRLDALAKEHREEVREINRQHHDAISRIADDYKTSIERVSAEMSRMREDIPSAREFGSDIKDQNIRLRDAITVVQQLSQELIHKLS